MLIHLPFLLVMLTILAILAGWRLLGNSLWLATMGLLLWWYCNQLAPLGQPQL